MIGMSLSYEELCDTCNEKLKPESLLPKLWDKGVRSIELRQVKWNEDPSEVLRVANIIWDYGFQITVHGRAQGIDSAVEDVFVPLEKLLRNMRQRELVVVIHPVVGDNAVMLTALSDHIIENGYPVRIALENNRKMPDLSDGNSLALVLDAVKRADRKNIGTCFDMGHFAWYAKNFTDSPDTLPPREFLDLAIHTHIHSYTEGSTHFPLEEWGPPVSMYVDALGFNYFGVYNIEIEAKRFAHRWDALEAYQLSADTLRENYPIRAKQHDEERERYDGLFLRSLSVFRKKEGVYGTMIAPSSYLFSTDGYKWAVDVSFHRLRYVAETPWHIKDYLGDIDCMFLTHAHVDHLEKKTVRALRDTEIKWIVPTFLMESVLEFGVRPEYITEVRAGDVIDVGPLHVRVLDGRHKRASEVKGTPCVGYLICSDNGPSIAFPGDVRDYSMTDEEALNADYCFAHLWLTDQALYPQSYLPMCPEFAEFMLKGSRKNIFITHLYVDRTDDKRWTIEHAYAASRAIREISPDTVVRIPRIGEIFKF